MFENYLQGYLARHIDTGAGRIGKYAEISFKRLTRITRSGRRQGQQSPSVEELQNALVWIPCGTECARVS
jgi:hypothetical protein